MLTCPSKHFFHFDCPGCGMQRSLLALLEGDLNQSIQLYPATLPLIFLIGFTFLHLKFDFKYGANIIQWTYLGCALIIVTFFIYKLLTHVVS